MWSIRFVHVNTRTSIDLKIIFYILSGIFFNVTLHIQHVLCNENGGLVHADLDQRLSSGDFRVGHCTRWGGRTTGQQTTPGNRWTTSSPVSTLWKTSSRRERKIRKGEQRKERKRRWDRYRYIVESSKMEEKENENKRYWEKKFPRGRE